MKTIVKFLQSLLIVDPVAPEIIRAKAYEMWKAQGGGDINPDANWQAAIEQLQLTEKLSRRNFILELIRLVIASLSTGATIFGGSILFLNFSQGENRLITERFTRSIEQLGNKEETIRIGGIYALERIANDSPRDGWTIMEVLSSFIRGKQSIKGQDTSQLPTIRTDAQAALTVIDRRQIDLETDRQYLDLSLTNLREANLVGAQLDRVKLNSSILTKADLRGANLNLANLSNANLDGANLTKAQLDRANLIQANLSNTNLSAANLNEANLNKADLSDAILDGAILTNASLGNTNLTSSILIGANLRGATLSKANLSKADLSGADLYQVNLAGANLNKTDLRKIKNLNITQIKQAQNWLLAIYDSEIDLLLKAESA
ncbi:pentapeptide repeat-containing protein [Chamaesiphon sp. VAR_48_metabat_135_sub]|uniref:pentapeptide repeat-containing protein n=1 Tax=Chamaesiphon sp. VAR_48_metabat_135_sub TaxID=2964699 RepID=UPI00286BC24A|nr:pentapeptide repeat-containing protein [Chamaesiphon sp. VAR_48_metabat_135_sub]